MLKSKIKRLLNFIRYLGSQGKEPMELSEWESIVGLAKKQQLKFIKKKRLDEVNKIKNLQR